MTLENIDPDLAALTARYREYVDGYRGQSGALPPMMALKLAHTMQVVAAAREIAAGENFTPAERHAAEAAALLHDTGRYEQLRRYNTFRDSDSVDHAVFSHDIVRDSGWLDGWPDREEILFAVLVHNRRELPVADAERSPFSPLALTAARAVRDADKLDIFRVLENQVATTDWRHDSKAFWDLPATEPPSAGVLSAVREGRPVDYGQIATLADFVLVQIGWMISGLEYATSRRLCAARGHLEFRRRFLIELGAGAEAGELCDLARRRCSP